MVAVSAGLLLAVVLLVSAAAKAIDFYGTRAALATYGITGRDATRLVGVGLVAAEALLAPAVALGVRPATWLAAGLLAAFALAQSAALVVGRRGAPCACLGARGRLGPASVGRTAAILALALAAAALPRTELTSEQWLGLGLGAALVGLAALSVVVLALAREVGALRLALTPQGALEVPHEGPEIGGHTELAEHFGADLEPGRLALAVFSSQGCAMCQALAPVVSAFGRNPRVALRTFDEVSDADAWSAADVPGSPYAVALDHDGTVLAKGTFNSGAQLESVLGTAERRRAERASGAGARS